MSDWNAGKYHEISSPQQSWGRKVLDRLPLAGHELVLDIGCGTGRLTELIAKRVPDGRVIGLDRSEAMIHAAAAWLRAQAPAAAVVLGDAVSLPFRRVFDAVFSGATFHWIHDHGALFRSIVMALKPGGRLVAQCGGGPNLSLLYARAEALMRAPRFANYFEDWEEPTYFADVETTRDRLQAAGFVDVDVSLEEAPTTFDSPEQFHEFIAHVCVRGQVARLSNADRTAFLRELTVAAAMDKPAFTLDYWRLNIAGTRPA
jgi:trans-aconitate 2-methyltransferase